MQRYRLIFDGHIQPQTSPEDVQRRLADLFQVPPEQINDLFARPPVVLKEDLGYEDALKDKASFETTGALCRLEPQSPPPLSKDGYHRNRPAHETLSTKEASSSGERRYGLFHPYGLAFFSRAFYADVAAHWRGLAFVHLLLVMLLAATAYVIHFQSLVDRFIAEEAPAIVEQVPEIVITEGSVHVNVDEPYTIRQPESGRAFAIIDTSGEITSLRQTEATLLLTTSRLAVRLAPNDIRTIDLRPIASLRIDQAAVVQWLGDIQKWAPVIMFPLTLGFAFLFRSAQALLYGGLGMALAALRKTPLPYGAAVSVAIMALTPVIIVDALLVWTNTYLPLWGFGSFMLALGYLVFGIRSAARSD